ncbi:hypothetical protein [Maribacter sp. 2210JD10-5]|uniref:hypothetical protein n=1 Tax=Maribacter sp. 2210JD10-5 TaxID=3386272 RepID=UPI0039BC8CAD
MNRKRIVFIVIALLALALFIVNMLRIEYSTANWKDYMGPTSNVLLIIAMTIMAKNTKNEKNE